MRVRCTGRRHETVPGLLLELLLLLVGAAPAIAQTPAPSVPVSPEEVVRGDPAVPRLSLVINVGAGYTPATDMLDTLRERGVRTTFFVLGWWAERHPELLARIAADGHEIASHGHSVFDLTRVSDAEVIADLERADAAISAVTGRTTRPLWSPSAGARDERVRQLAASLGYRPIYWTVDSGDWRADATADGVRRRVLEGASNGAIIVLHFDSPTTVATTAAVLGDLIDALRARGFELVPITELLTGASPAAPAATTPAVR
ncbi:MAG TPA: polysaccharide deacetylase family protein [Chloroflexota bacterium]|nr:polysaccharide deacetylase family protein [Chloroflexota bacterium]